MTDREIEYIPNVPKTAVDVFRLLPEGTKCEVIDNVLYMFDSPVTIHQRILRDMSVNIDLYLRRTGSGTVFFAPLAVYLPDRQSAVMPDIIVLLKENEDKIHEDGVYGAPDLVIEILSDDKHRDLVLKKNLYERVGVKEYIIVEPETKETTVYILTGGSYKEQFKGVAQFNSSLIKLEFNFRPSLY